MCGTVEERMEEEEREAGIGKGIVRRKREFREGDTEREGVLGEEGGAERKGRGGNIGSEVKEWKGQWEEGRWDREGM